MTNSTLGKIIISSIILAFVAVIFEESGELGVAEALYTVAGLGFVVFGLWGGIRLTKTEE